MNEDIILMLDEQVKAEIEGLASLQLGSKEHTEAIKSIGELYRLRIDDSEAAMKYNKEIDDDEFRKKEAEKEEESRKVQLAEQKKDRVVKIAIAGAELFIPLMFFAKIYQMGYDLEKDGTFTVQTLKNLIRFIKPTKR